jgi:hypothetical protein
MPRQVSGPALAALGGGAVLIYGGVTGRSPLLILQQLIRGGGPSGAPVSSAIPTTDPTFTADGGTPGTPGPGGSGSSPGPGAGGPPASSSAARNQNIARLMMHSYGWDSNGVQWSSLQALWTRESGWSNTADTRRSGLDPPHAGVFAYGIAQARPATKYPLAGRPPDLGGRADPTAQIRWGLQYIKTRPGYGSPVAALAHENRFGWY